MEILEIHRQKSYFEVTTDAAVYEIDGSLLREYNLSAGVDADEEILQTLHETSRFRRAYQRACYLLDAQDYSYAMLYRKLMLTYRDRALCKKVCDKLHDASLIDDRRYAEKCAEYLVERKKYGIYRARQEMLHRGLDKTLVEHALADLEESAEENLPAVLEKKYGRLLTDPKDFKSRQKVIAGMARLGYNFQSVKHAIEDYFADWEDEEE